MGSLRSLPYSREKPKTGAGSVKYYPLFLDIKGKEVLVIGGGVIALEKILNLLKAGAKITVVAPEISKSVRRFNRRITYVYRKFQDQDIQEKYLLIFAATGDSTLNAKVSQACLKRRILCNTVDDPKWCHFIVPAIMRRGYLTIAISTAGVSPTLAKWVKTILYATFRKEVTQLTRFLNVFRQDIKVKIPTLSGRMMFWKDFYALKPMSIMRRSGIEALKKTAYNFLENYNG